MLQDISRIGVQIRVSATAVEITESGVIVESDGQTDEIPADSVVLALGSVSHNALAAFLEEKGLPYETVGDARRVATAFDAIHEGFHAGRNI